MKLLAPLIFAGLLSLSSCQPIHSTDALNHVGTGLARIDGDVDSAAKSVTNAKPHADPVGSALLDDSLSHLGDAKTHLVTTGKAYTQALKDNTKLQADYEHDHNTIGNKIERFILGAFWTCVIVGGLLWIGAQVLFIVCPATGIWSVISEHLHALLPAQNLAPVLKNWINPTPAPTPIIITSSVPLSPNPPPASTVNQSVWTMPATP